MAMVVAGEIGTFAFGFVPAGWACCDGQILPITDYGDLFAVLGTSYGGDGETHFAIPDLNGRVAVSAGKGPETSPYAIAQQAGVDSVALEAANMPMHVHTLYGGLVTPDNPSQNTSQPTAGAMFSTSHPKFLYRRDDFTTDFTLLHPNMIGRMGGSGPHANVQPFLTLNFCIALSDID